MYSFATVVSRLALASLASFFSAPGVLSQEPVEKTLTLASGESLEYVERLPYGEGSEPPYGLFVCLPPGNGDRSMVTAARKHLGDLAWREHYLTVYPVARSGGFMGDAAGEVVELLEHVIEEHEVDVDRIVLAGISNGGRAAFDVAQRAPHAFAAIVAVPGAASEETVLKELKGTPVWMRVGAVDSEGWRDDARATAERLRAAGCAVDFAEIEGQAHVLALADRGLFRWLEKELTPAPRRIQFPAPDGLPIEAELYGAQDRSRPMIVLCHQARSSRGEYATIAPRLAAAGFACLAIDQRSGGEMNGVANETAARALAAGKAVGYLDARVDIEAALDWARDAGFKGPLVLWGSSYSASLALAIGADREDLACLLSFSPGEYFGADNPIGRAASRIQCPVLVVSPEGERGQSEPLVEVIQSERVYVIEEGILHGSSTLFRGEASAQVWEKVLGFLAKHGVKKP